MSMKVLPMLLVAAQQAAAGAFWNLTEEDPVLIASGLNLLDGHGSMGRLTVTPGHAWQCVLPTPDDDTTEDGSAGDGSSGATTASQGGDGGNTGNAGAAGDADGDVAPIDPCDVPESIKTLQRTIAVKMELSDPPEGDQFDHTRSLILELASKSAPYEKLTFTYGETHHAGDATTDSTFTVDGKFFLDRSPDPLPTILDLAHGEDSPTVTSQEVTLASESEPQNWGFKGHNWTVQDWHLLPGSNEVTGERGRVQFTAGMSPDEASMPTYPDLGDWEFEEFEMRVLVVNWHHAFLPFFLGEADLGDGKQFSHKDFGTFDLSFEDEFTFIPESAVNNFMTAMLVVSATIMTTMF